MFMEDSRWLVGEPGQISDTPDVPFSKETMEFLEDLSGHILRLSGRQETERLKVFGFWCRKAHLERMKRMYGPKEGEEYRLGLGLLFHIAPSNVPGMFAWSMAIGLLSGNSNIIRVSERNIRDNEMFCSAVKNVLEQEKHREMRKRIGIVSYDKGQTEITEYFSNHCDGRLIWGGDDTIRSVQKCTKSVLAEEVVFPDRVSAALLRTGAILNAKEEELTLWAGNFYNDTYAMDQNACSSPRLILWYEEQKGEAEKAKEIWWNAVRKQAEVYPLAEKQAFEKYTRLCRIAVQKEGWLPARRYGNLLYVIPLAALDNGLWEERTDSGTFFQYVMENMETLKKIGGRKTQTLTCLGFDKRELKEFILQSKIKGIDRVVPVGQAMEMDLTWDGKNLIERLSRRIG